jgi:hypothetical protein
VRWVFPLSLHPIDNDFDVQTERLYRKTRQIAEEIVQLERELASSELKRFRPRGNGDD